MSNSQEHAVRLRSLMGDFQSMEKWCDVTLIAKTDKNRISAHRLVLASSSEYFRAMFTCGLSECTQNEVILENVIGEHLISLVKYCYSGDIVITAENVEDLMSTASLLQFNEVVNMCGKFHEKNLHSSNCLGFAAVATHFNCSTLLRRAEEYICDHFEEVCKSKEFLLQDEDSLGKLLVIKKLNITSEVILFTCLMDWFQYDTLKRLTHFRQLLRLLPMLILPEKFVEDFVEPLCHVYGCSDVLQECLEWSSENYNRYKARVRSSGLLGLFTGSSTITIEKYCPERDTWRSFAKIPSSRQLFGCVAIKEHILIIGGTATDDTEVYNSVLCFNVRTKETKQLAPMMTKRFSLGTAVVDGIVYAVGGITDQAPLNIVERYDPTSDSWSYAAPMPLAKYGVAVAALTGHLYVVGGNGTNGRNTKTTQMYDPESNKWTLKANMLHERRNCGISVNRGYLYVLGGFISTYGNIVERYDPHKNEWNRVFSLTTISCLSFCAFLPGDRLVTVSTKMTEGFMALGVEEYNTKTEAFEIGVDCVDDLRTVMYLGLCDFIPMPYS